MTNLHDNSAITNLQVTGSLIVARRRGLIGLPSPRIHELT